MTEEQIKQNAHTYTNDHGWTWDDSGESRVDISGEISDAYLAGAHSRDEEIDELKHEVIINSHLRASCQEEVKELQKQLEKFSNRNGYTTPGDACIQTARWADAHQPNPWRDAETDEPKKDQDVFAYVPNLCGGEYCKLTYLGNYRWSQDEGEYTTEFYNKELLWMPIPELPIEERLINGLQELNEHFKKGE